MVASIISGFDPSSAKPTADILFQDVLMDAELAEGAVRVGEDGAPVSSLNLSAGTRVQAQLSQFGFSSGADVDKSRFEPQ